jgi:RimJ/RimL family protein N-acetyltransferase
MTTTIFIEKSQRLANRNLINEIANSVFGSEEKAAFSEEFVPVRCRVPKPKSEQFANYLLNSPRLLWAIQFNKTTVGFILIGDMPHRNAMGISINHEYYRKGVASEAFSQIKSHSEISYPVFGYTSVRNINAQRFMESIGFKREPENIDFCGENSYKYKLE